MKDSFLNSANVSYVAELFFKYKEEPQSVDKSWYDFFSTLKDEELSILGDFGGPEWKKRNTSVINDKSFDKQIVSAARIK